MSPQRIKPSVGFRLVVMISALAAAAVALSAAGQTAKRPITLDDLFKIKSVGDPQRSPDGKWVAYTVGTTDVEKDKRDTDLWMVGWDGARRDPPHLEPRRRIDPPLEPGRPLPGFSRFPRHGGGEEARRPGLAARPEGRRGPEAHGDQGRGQRLRLVAGRHGAWSIVSSDQDPADEPEKMEGWKRKTAPPIVIDRYHFKQDREGYLKRLYEHLWLFDVASRKAEPLTSGPSNDTSPVWSPDGSRIAFLSERGPDLDRDPDSDRLRHRGQARSGADPADGLPGARRRPSRLEPRRPVDRVPARRRAAVLGATTSTSWPSCRRRAAPRGS